MYDQLTPKLQLQAQWTLLNFKIEKNIFMQESSYPLIMSLISLFLKDKTVLSCYI